MDEPPSTPTLKDVARAADVSPMTVSRVVNDRPGVGEATRERVERVVEALGYRPNIVARGLKASRSYTIGLLVPDITNPFFPEIVRGAEDVAFASGYTLFLGNVIESRHREAQVLGSFEDRMVDGVIACSPRLSQTELHRLLRRHPAAVVMHRSAPERVAASVRLDHARGMCAAVDHMRSLGRSRIGILAGPATSHAAKERIRGIRIAAEELGVHLDEDRFRRASPTLDGGEAAAAHLFDTHPDTDALICFNDLVAAGAMRACAATGRTIPGDVAIMGHDDILFAAMFRPPLTTLRVPKYESGAAAMRLLLARIEGAATTSSVMLEPELVVRASTVGPHDATQRRNA